MAVISNKCEILLEKIKNSMPIRQCQINNNPGYKWGQECKCYEYTPGDEESIKEAKKWLKYILLA